MAKSTRQIITELLDCVDEPITDADVDDELEAAGVDVPKFLEKVRAKCKEACVKRSRMYN